MHYGYWDESTSGLRQALARQNEVLAEIARLKPSDRVLDAGCGVGGSSIYLASHAGVKVSGITLSRRQAKAAERSVRAHGVSSAVDILVSDYTVSPFPNESFEVVWAIESMCHAHRKADFLREAHRLLVPGGRLVVADGFTTDAGAKASRDSVLGRWLKSWAVPHLPSFSEFPAQLGTIGFRDASIEDATDKILPSARRLYARYWAARPAVWLGAHIGLRHRLQTSNAEGCRYQYEALRQKLWCYGIVCATK